MGDRNMFSIGNMTGMTTGIRMLQSSYADLERSNQRIASGLRINSSKDDAAGSAIRGYLPK
jgi:flagellin-like hook-associated protein FlgL